MWEIKGKDNETKATIYSVEFDDKWMEESYVTATIESPAPIDFAIGDYLMYRGERFEINYDPGKIKSAPRYEKGDAFKYENVKFNSLADELTRCDFLDVVKGDNQLHFTGLPKFNFYGGVQDLADRIQANLDRAYPGMWKVIVSPEYSGTKELDVSVDNIKVQGALSILVNDFETYFTINGRTITIGAAGIPAAHLFKYGKGNGLSEVEQNAEADQVIVTRLRAYGSTRNLPHRYYNALTDADGKKLIPDNMAVQYLMLPDFPYTTQDPYIDSTNIAALGVREGTIFFDGSQDGLEEIYPSIKGMTAEQLLAAGVPCNSTGALDELVSAEQMTDNGVGEISEDSTETTATPPTFKVTLKDLGFDINEHRSGEAPALSFKSGMLGGRDFEIVECKKLTDAAGNVTGYELELNRVYDDGIKLWFPYATYNAKAGDKFVLLYIEMPEVYIKAAAQRLLEAAKAWLAKNDYSRSIYSPKVDEIFMARQHDEAMASGGTIVSLHDTLRAGSVLLFEDEDLNIDAAIPIDQLTIKEGDDSAPTYEVVLKEEKTVGRLDKMQNQIDSLASGGQGGGYTAAQIRAMIDAYGSTRFLSKLKNDRAAGKIASDLGFEIGNYLAGVSGGMFGIDSENGDSFAEVMRLYVRGRAYFETLTMIEADALAGKQYITPGGGIKCVKVEENGLVPANLPFALESGGNILLESGGRILDEESALVDNGIPVGVYRCYFLSEQDGEKITTKFVAGDQAISEMFNAKAGTTNKVSNHRYWRLVTAVSNDAYVDESGNHYGYIDLSKADCEPGSTAPKAGDTITQFGNRNDTTRQAAMSFSTVDADAPSIKLLTGIDSYTLVDKDIISQGYDHVEGRAYFKCYGDTYIGARDGSTYVKYNQATKELDVKARLSIQSTVGDKTLEEVLEGVDASEYLRRAFPQDTEITGGVIMSTLLSLGYKDAITQLRHTLAGMNGAWDSELGGKTIATWWGGKPVDRELATDGADLTDAATGLVRMDGSGYLAKGLVRWNADGSGSVANGVISWDAAGRVTLGSGVTIDVAGAEGLQSTLGDILQFINGISKFLVPAKADGTELTWAQYAQGVLLKARTSLFASGGLSALGLAPDITGGTSGGGSTVELLTDWTHDPGGKALSATLGVELHADVDTALRAANIAESGVRNLDKRVDQLRRWSADRRLRRGLIPLTAEPGMIYRNLGSAVMRLPGTAGTHIIDLSQYLGDAAATCSVSLAGDHGRLPSDMASMIRNGAIVTVTVRQAYAYPCIMLIVGLDGREYPKPWVVRGADGIITDTDTDAPLHEPVPPRPTFKELSSIFEGNDASPSGFELQRRRRYLTAYKPGFKSLKIHQYKWVHPASLSMGVWRARRRTRRGYTSEWVYISVAKNTNRGIKTIKILE